MLERILVSSKDFEEVWEESLRRIEGRLRIWASIRSGSSSISRSQVLITLDSLIVELSSLILAIL